MTGYILLFCPNLIDVFILDTLRNVSGGHLAMLIPKGIERFPDTNDKISGTIDIWWIVRILLHYGVLSKLKYRKIA